MGRRWSADVTIVAAGGTRAVSGRGPGASCHAVVDVRRTGGVINQQDLDTDWGGVLPHLTIDGGFLVRLADDPLNVYRGTDDGRVRVGLGRGWRRRCERSLPARGRRRGDGRLPGSRSRW